ncbi:MAG: hypothetical protein MRK01_04285 [Candidatus Scalindua sp.]|nr:hypothetical protein [Candidatus Scalindua sp.]
MIAEKKQKKRSLLKIGFMLVLVSYMLWAPTFLFVVMSFSGKAWLWCLLATVSYTLSWILLVAGFLLAGPDAARSGRRWIARLLGQKTISKPI